jgi:hypothetical protein
MYVYKNIWKLPHVKFLPFLRTFDGPPPSYSYCLSD